MLLQQRCRRCLQPISLPRLSPRSSSGTCSRLFRTLKRTWPGAGQTQIKAFRTDNGHEFLRLHAFAPHVGRPMHDEAAAFPACRSRTNPRHANPGTKTYNETVTSSAEFFHCVLDTGVLPTECLIPVLMLMLMLIATCNINSLNKV